LLNSDKSDKITRVMATESTGSAPAQTPAEVVAGARRSGSAARLVADRWAMTGAAVAVAFVALAVFAPLLSGTNGNDPYTYHLGLLAGSGVPKGALGGVSPAHWLGSSRRPAATCSR
jgi:peptide/nickel transport system permease protein